MILNKKELDALIKDIQSLKSRDRIALAKANFDHLVKYFNILLGDEDESKKYVHAFSFILLNADNNISDKEYSFIKSALRVNRPKETLKAYFNELNNKEYTIKSLKFISRSGEETIKKALSLGISIIVSDNEVTKEEEEWLLAIIKQLSSAKY